VHLLRRHEQERRHLPIELLCFGADLELNAILFYCGN
jgi:hypothetical protein